MSRSMQVGQFSCPPELWAVLVLHRGKTGAGVSLAGGAKSQGTGLGGWESRDCLIL